MLLKNLQETINAHTILRYRVQESLINGRIYIVTSVDANYHWDSILDDFEQDIETIKNIVDLEKYLLLEIELPYVLNSGYEDWYYNDTDIDSLDVNLLYAVGEDLRDSVSQWAQWFDTTEGTVYDEDAIFDISLKVKA